MLTTTTLRSTVLAGFIQLVRPMPVKYLPQLLTLRPSSSNGSLDKPIQEVSQWQKLRKKEARDNGCVHTLLGRAHLFPSVQSASYPKKGHIERAAISTPVQGSVADVAMCAMLEISTNARLKELRWKQIMQIRNEVILEGPAESAEEAKAIVIECMSKPFYGTNILNVDLSVDAKCAQNWYAAK